MKAIITRVTYGTRKLGLRLISEGANDTILLEMLRDEYPEIRRRDARDGTMDIDIPIFHSHDDPTYQKAFTTERITIAPGDLYGLGGRGAKTSVTRLWVTTKDEGLAMNTALPEEATLRKLGAARSLTALSEGCQRGQGMGVGQ